jgi:hypothetical protein
MTTLVGLQMGRLLQRINERVRPVNKMVILLTAVGASPAVQFQKKMVILLF